MKKLFISLCLFLAITSVYAQNFVPDPTKVYNIVETTSNLVVGSTINGGLSTTQPALMPLTNSSSQAFNFVSTGAPDTYYLLNVNNYYLDKEATGWDSNWMTVFESSTNGTNSEWVISGTDSTSILLMCVANSLYLGADNNTPSSSLYCDRSTTRTPSHMFALKVATVDKTAKFSIVGNNIVFEIEKELQDYPIKFSASNQSHTINATATAGFSVNPSAFTPTDFANGGGTAQLQVSAPTAKIGDSGKVIFSYTSGGVITKLDSINITAVATYDRFFIKNNAGKFVIGSSTNPLVPMLDTIPAAVDNGSEYFFFRPVHHNVNDSLYYVVQDGDYNALKKNVGSHYMVDLGVVGDSLSVWKIISHPNGVKQIFNVVNQLSLGVDGVGQAAGIWDDKTFTPNPTSGPYCEWTFLSPATAVDPTISVLSSVLLSNGFLNTAFNGSTTLYDVLVPADVDSVTITGNPLSLVTTITANPVKVFAGEPAVLSVVSGDASSTTNYNFNLVQLTFDKWAAGSETSGTPNQYGWKCLNATWGSTNSPNDWTSRYFDNPAGYMYNGVAGWTGRVLYINWDGSPAPGVYSYPVSLEGGKAYTFTGKYAWNSITPMDTTNPLDTLSSTFTFAINPLSDNTGTNVASVDLVVKPSDLLNLHDARLTFTPATSGIYYLTIKSNNAIKAVIADLSIGLSTGLKNAVSSSIYATVSNQTIDIHGTLAGDAVKVYNISGQLVKQLTANSDITSINLKSGIYLIKVNATVLKVVK